MMQLDDTITYRFLTMDEWEKAMALAWRVFLRFESADYTEAGIENFQNFITDQSLKRMFLIGEYKVIAAYHQGEIVGIISLRNECHISLLFVDERFHRRGIGRKLVAHMRQEVVRMGGYKLTVNAAPYGLGFYRKVGFVDSDIEQFQSGIRFTPMSYIF